MEVIVTAPELLTEGHILQPFDCGNENQLFVISVESLKRVAGGEGAG
ncbi:hypothetical protein [Citrobacter amalonaticus]